MPRGAAAAPDRVPAFGCGCTLGQPGQKIRALWRRTYHMRPELPYPRLWCRYVSLRKVHPPSHPPGVSTTYRVTKRADGHLQGCEHTVYPRPGPAPRQRGWTMVDPVRGTPLATSGLPSPSRITEADRGEPARTVARAHRFFSGVAVVPRRGRGHMCIATARGLDQGSSGPDAAGLPPQPGLSV